MNWSHRCGSRVNAGKKNTQTKAKSNRVQEEEKKGTKKRRKKKGAEKKRPISRSYGEGGTDENKR